MSSLEFKECLVHNNNTERLSRMSDIILFNLWGVFFFFWKIRDVGRELGREGRAREGKERRGRLVLNTEASAPKKNRG